MKKGIYGALCLIIVTCLGVWGVNMYRVYQGPLSVSREVPQEEKGMSDTPLKSPVEISTDYDQIRERSIAQFSGALPREWSERADGVKTRLDTKKKVLALTFDACGGAGKDGYDAELIEYLKQEQIPATLFIGGKWIDAHPDIFQQLAENPLFDIENHGTRHIPCSVSGQSAYGIQGERGVGEVVDEIEQNARRIEALTGHKPMLYRSGTAFTDDVCPKIAESLGSQVVSYSVLGDAGATYSREQIVRALRGATPGSIALLHMNHPEKETAEGVESAIPLLRRDGWTFAKLSDYVLR